MEVSCCSLGDQGWICGKGTGFLFVSLCIPSVGHIYLSHQLVLGAVLLGLRHLECEGDHLAVKWRLLGALPPQLPYAFMPWNPSMRIIYVLKFWLNSCLCVTLIVICLIWYNLNTFVCLYTMIEICRLGSLEPWECRKYFLCFAWWLATWEKRVIF